MAAAAVHSHGLSLPVRVLAVTRTKLTEAEVTSIYRKYGALMLRRCKLVLRNDALADDALQNAFIKLIRHGASFREAEAKVRWLYRLCDRVCFDIIKKHKSNQTKDERAKHLPLPPQADPVRLQEALTLLNTLDEKERRLALMAFLDGMSQGEIGRELGWSRQTVNKKLSALKTRLRESRSNHE